MIEAVDLFDGFRDISYAYRFAPPGHDVVVATLLSDDGEVVSRTVHLPLGLNRAVEPDVGLHAVGRRDAADRWTLEVKTQRFAQFVVVDVPGFVPSDSWFHLPPGARQSVTLRRAPGS